MREVFVNPEIKQPIENVTFDKEKEIGIIKNIDGNYIDNTCHQFFKQNCQFWFSALRYRMPQRNGTINHDLQKNKGIINLVNLSKYTQKITLDSFQL